MDGPAAERDSLEKIGGIGSPLEVAHGANTEEREKTTFKLNMNFEPPLVRTSLRLVLMSFILGVLFPARVIEIDGL